MRNADRWTETKYVRRRGRLRASRDPAQVGVGSRLISDLVAAAYDRHLPRYARGRLIDLGCGTAPLYGAYRGLVDSVVCVDWANSPHAALYLDREVDLNGPLPFDAAAFDTLILSDVLEHVAEPANLWREMARVIAPGGHALINVPFLYGIHEAPHDYARYSEHALRRHAQQVGLTVRLLEPIGGSLHVLADLLAKHLAHVPLIGRLLASAVQAPVAWLDRVGLGRRIVARTATHFPLGYFMVAERPAAGTAR